MPGTGTCPGTILSNRKTEPKFQLRVIVKVQVLIILVRVRERQMDYHHDPKLVHVEKQQIIISRYWYSDVWYIVLVPGTFSC